MDDPRLAGGGDTLFYRWLLASDPAAPSVILLHGRTGDESVMWVVAQALPATGLIVAPRGPFRSPDNGFSWAEPERAESHHLEDLGPGASALARLVDTLEAERGLDREQMILVGFSQGAALAFAAAGVGRLQPRGIVALAAFLPQGELGRLRGLPIFWGHGTRDALVPIEVARADVARLRRIGAQVHLCEADVEHRVGVECMRGLKQWWHTHFPDGRLRAAGE